MSAGSGPEDAAGGAPAVGGTGGLRGAHVRHHLRGHGHGRLGGHRVLRWFGLAFALFVGAGTAISALAAPKVTAACTSTQACGVPVKLPQPLVNQSVWHSSHYGFTLEYPGDELSVTHSDGDGVTLDAQLKNGNDVAIVIRGTPATLPGVAITSALGGLSGISGLAVDSDPKVAVLGPGVGHVAGSGGVWAGSLVAPQGVSQQVDVAAEAATRGGVTIVAMVVAAGSDSGPQSSAWSLGDSIFNSVRWSGR